MPPASAPHEEQIAAALRAVASGRMRGVSVGGGRPRARGRGSGLSDGRPAIERTVRGVEFPDTDDWDAPLTPNGCEDVARAE